MSSHLRITFLTKRFDSCAWLRIINPLSQLVARGHECWDESFERQLFCSACAQAGRPHGPYEFQWDHEGEIVCPSCRFSMMSEQEVSEWRERILSQADQADLVVFQRPTELSHLKLMRRVKGMGKKIIQTADDHYLDVPAFNSGYHYYSLRRATVEESFRLCDAVDVTTPVLKQVYEAYCPKVSVLPNSLDLEILDQTPALKHLDVFNRAGVRISEEDFTKLRSGKKVILWGGSPTHEKDLEMIVSACRRISRSEQVVFVFVGYIHQGLLEAIPQDRLILVGLVSSQQYYALYKALSADIGLAPVVDVPFNHAKSNLKAIEYQALGILPVMSDLITYRGSSPCGIYAQNDEYSWYLAMKKAIHREPDELAHALQMNRKFCEDHFDIKKNVLLWEQFYEEVLAGTELTKAAVG